MMRYCFFQALQPGQLVLLRSLSREVLRPRPDPRAARLGLGRRRPRRHTRPSVPEARQRVAHGPGRERRLPNRECLREIALGTRIQFSGLVESQYHRNEIKGRDTGTWENALKCNSGVSLDSVLYRIVVFGTFVFNAVVYPKYLKFWSFITGFIAVGKL